MRKILSSAVLVSFVFNLGTQTAMAAASAANVAAGAALPSAMAPAASPNSAPAGDMSPGFTNRPFAPAPTMPQAGQSSNPNAIEQNAANPANPANPADPNARGGKNDSPNDVRSMASRNSQLIGLDAPAPNAFQTFIAQTTGKSVPIFGQSLFLRVNPFAALESVPVPANYVLGPGDELYIKVYSAAFDVDQRMVISRDGTIVLPKLGPVVVSGTRADEIEKRLKGQLGKILSDFNVSVTMGQLRGIEIYVVGQARAPGKYVVSSVSTLINALFATGGPTGNGSMRNIQLVRDSKVVGSVDLYDFLTKGDTSKDMHLLPGDVINIIPIGPQVALLGTTQNPAVYELLLGQKGNQLSDIIRHAGGLQSFTTPMQASLERMDPSQKHPLSAVTLALDDKGLKTSLKDGDIVTLFPIKAAFENAVSLRILGAPPIRVPITAGSKVKDVIPDRDALLTSNYFMRRFNPPGSSAGTNDDVSRIHTNARLDQINWDYAMIERINPKDYAPQVLTFNLAKAIIDGDSKNNLELLPGDTITVFSQNDIQVPLDQQMRVVRIQGEVNAPGIYQLQAGETVNQLIARAGGLTKNAYLYGTELSRQSVRADQKKNIAQLIKQLEVQMTAQNLAVDYSSGDAAQVQKEQRMLNQEALRQKINYLRTANPSGRVAMNLNPEDEELPDFNLEDGDEVRIPYTPTSVYVAGAVNSDSAFIYKPGQPVSAYLKLAGLSQTAEPDEIFLVRADGVIVSPRDMGWMESVKTQKVMPGDSIVVPEKIVKETGYSVFMRGLKDWSAVLGQLGITAVAIKVLKQ